MSSCYLYLEGLQRLAKTLVGNEKIHLGIRPYQFHAGNILSVVAYPYLLCEELKNRGLEPAFTFLVSLNDWEQDELVGEDIYRYIFDVKPKHTTIQFLETATGIKLVDYWQKKISQEMSGIIKDFPKVSVKYIRNSDLKKEPLLFEALLHTLKHRAEHKTLLLNTTKILTIGSDMHFANAVCESCHSVDTNTEVISDSLVSMRCAQCGNASIKKVNEFDYWFYHKELFSARLAILKFNISISGSDHYAEGDYETRKALYEFIYQKPFPKVKMLFAPILTSYDGKKMSKSRANYEYRPLREVLPVARISYGPTVAIKAFSKEITSV